jgi:hypothetical protein
MLGGDIEPGVAGHSNVRMRHFSQTVALNYENFTDIAQF